jgi:2-keto-4-pentenoate hydratase/2-oxohepta-3-ene-1,7-dioic acid hydratase in catechol pathway
VPKGVVAHHEGIPLLLQLSTGAVFSESLHTVELGLVIGKGGRDISQADAESHIAGYGEFFIYIHYAHDYSSNVLDH